MNPPYPCRLALRAHRPWAVRPTRTRRRGAPGPESDLGAPRAACWGVASAVVGPDRARLDDGADLDRAAGPGHRELLGRLDREVELRDDRDRLGPVRPDREAQRAGHRRV